MKTIIWTDTLQTTFMLSTVVIISYTLMKNMDLNFSSLLYLINESDYSRTFFFDNWTDKKYFFKQFFSGMFMAIVMTGLDQDQMQKNLDKLGGLINSQRILLELTQKGMTREDSYEAVQRNAMPVWLEGKDFKALLKSDTKIRAFLDENEIDELFNPDFHFKHVETIFKRVFG